ncbi:MAG: hypothetical protein Q9226_003830 [Calogaya cf. arnoldii]
MASTLTFEQTYLDFHNTLYRSRFYCSSIPEPPTNLKEGVTLAWAELLRREFIALHEDLDINERAYHGPRRKSRNLHEADLAKDVAQLLYPSPSHSTLPALIKYHHDLTLLRRTILAQEKTAEDCRLQYGSKETLKERIASQGPWNEKTVWEPRWLDGVPARPMPVEVSTEHSLAPFFDHLQHGGSYKLDIDGPGQKTEEPYYGVEMGEWEKGMLYQDGRMDLCKKVVGPDWIGRLMSSLKSNTFVRHFLLGNNIIGPTGVLKIVVYLLNKPNQMETWYLAGNCIDSAAFEDLATYFTRSSTITNIWLKRNPLTSKSVPDLFKLITETQHLRTLDLDQTELSNAGVAELFDRLAVDGRPNLPLRHLYLNADGISVAACTSIATYLATSNCPIESLYISNNPIGDEGALALAQGLAANTKLVRLSMRSCGLKDAGAIAIMNALTQHPNIMTLNISHSYATKDLGTWYNFFDDKVEEATLDLLKTSHSLRYLDFGITGMSVACITTITKAVKESHLLVFKAESVYNKLPLTVRHALRASLTENVKAKYGQDMTYAEFEEGKLFPSYYTQIPHASSAMPRKARNPRLRLASVEVSGEQRWLNSPPDVRFIDSGYRNRDAGLARRHLIKLKKTWDDDDELARIIGDESTKEATEEEDYFVMKWGGFHSAAASSWDDWRM